MSLSVGNHSAKNVGPSSNVLVSTAITTTAGNGVVVAVLFNASETFTSLADNKSNAAPTQIGSEQPYLSFKTRLYYFPKLVGAGSGHTFTLTVSTTCEMVIYIQEISATQANGILLDQQNSQGDAATPFQSPSVLTTLANELAYAVAFGNGDPDTWAVDNGTALGTWTRQDLLTDGSVSWTGGQATAPANSVTNYQSSWTSTGSTDSYQWIATFSEVSGGSALTINVSDATGLSESLIMDLLLNPNVSDAATLSESVAGTTGVMLVVVNDAVTVSEAIFLTSGFLLLPQASDSTTVTDAPTVLLTKLFISVTDATAVTDGGITFSFAQNSLAINVGDAVVMLDVVGGVQTFTGLFFTVSDSVNVNKGFAIIAWNANSEPDLAGYRVYQGTTSGVYGPITYPYTNVVANFYDVGNVLTYTVLNLAFGTTYFFVVTAYDTSGNESAPSAEVSKAPTDVLLGNVHIFMNAFNISDATTVTDVPVMDMLVTIRVNDGNVIVSEGMVVAFPFEAVAPFDATAVTETVSITFTTLGGLAVSVSDATAVTELVNANFSGVIAGNDATTVTDAPQLNMLVIIPAMAAGQDTTAVTDASTAQIVLSGVLTVFDSTAVTDATTVVMNKILLNVFDSVLVSDGFNLAPRLTGPGGNLTSGRLTNIAGTSQDTVLT